MKRDPKSAAKVGSLLLATLALQTGCTKPPDSAKAEFRPEQIQSQVRVVLLRAGYTDLTTHPSTFRVTYGVEIPAQGAFSDLSFDSNTTTLFQRGTPLVPTGGSSSASMAFSDLPSRGHLRQPVVQEGRLMICEEVLYPGLRVDTEQVEVQLRLSWRGSPVAFAFTNVPVGFPDVGDDA